MSQKHIERGKEGQKTMKEIHLLDIHYMNFLAQLKKGKVVSEL
jgi:translation elongation factor EF-4